MYIIVVLIGYAILVIVDFVPLYKQEKWRDFWVNAVLGAFSLTIAILLCLNFKFPSPETPIRQVITVLFGK